MDAITNKWNNLDQDTLLMEWQHLKDNVEVAKSAEMELRKYIVSRAFPSKHEGTNTQELGNGYALKAVVKYNYNLDPDNKKVEAALDKIATIGNQGSFIAERLVNWKPSFLLSEYRELLKEVEEGNSTSKAIIAEIHKVLTITEGAPTLEIKEPKVKK
jgi:hypothetical protein